MPEFAVASAVGFIGEIVNRLPKDLTNQVASGFWPDFVPMPDLLILAYGSRTDKVVLARSNAGYSRIPWKHRRYFRSGTD